ncbi:MAG: MFS transporter [Thermogutta sp.]|nr:MFS transporter [Thermogutta sp.]
MFRALRHRNYQLFFAGQSVSVIGTWMGRMAISWLVWRLTGSAAMLGLVAFLGALPSLVLAPFGGSVVDWFGRYRVLLASQAGLGLVALVLGALVLTGNEAIWSVILLETLVGVVRAFDVPARQSLVVDLVDDRADLGNVIALNSTMVHGAQLIGPTVAGPVIAAVGEGILFLADGLSYLFVIAAMLAMRIPARRQSTGDRAFLAHFAEGWRYTRRSLSIRSFLMLMAMVSLLAVPYTVLLPVFADRVIGGGATTLGFLTAASGAGAVLGGIYLASRRTVVGLGRVISIGAGLFGAALIAFAFAGRLWAAMLLLPLAGYGMMTVMAGCNTALQTLVDDDKRGRVMAFFTMAFQGTAPIGNLIAGFLAEHLGVQLTVAVGGIACLVSACWFLMTLPAIRAASKPVLIERGVIAAEAVLATAERQLTSGG